MRAYLLALCCALLVGCAGNGPSPFSSIGSIGGTVSTDGTNWAAGFTITFKDAPSQYAADQLLALGGDPHEVDNQPARIWYFRNSRNPSDPVRQKAVSVAAASGIEFSLTPY